MVVRKRRLVGAVGVVAACTAVCLAGPPTATAAPQPGGGVGGRSGASAQTFTRARADGPAPTIPQRYLDQSLDLFLPCDDFDEDFLCTRVTVPLDWRHPDAHPDITLKVSYAAATGSSKGLLTANPGGPGGSGVDLPSILSNDRPQLRTDYDLLGFDPRGYGDSNPVDCPTTQAKLDALPTTFDYRDRSRRTHRVEVAEAKLYAEACSANALSPFISTEQTAFDMELLRALFEKSAPQPHPSYDKLNYIGYSYGTWLGAYYADFYPQHVGRFLFDSNMNWTASMYANQTYVSWGFERRRDKMFFPWLARHDATYHYGRTAAAVFRHYERSRAKLARQYRNGGDTSPNLMDDFILESMYTDSGFKGAAEILQIVDAIIEADSSVAARRATAELLRRSDRLADRHPRGTLSGGAPVTTAEDDEPAFLPEAIAAQIISCNDTPYPGDIAALLRRADRDAARYPFIGYRNTVTMCSFWPFRTARRTIDLADAPRILMIQPEGDPATPYEGSLAAHKATAAHTRLVSIDDEGQHAVYIGGPSVCAQQVGDAWVFDGVMPAKDVVCGTEPLPDEAVVYPLDGPVRGRRHSLDADRTHPATTAPGSRLAAKRAEVARLSMP